MGLQQDLQAEAALMLAGCPDAALRRFRQSITELRESGVLDEAVGPGEMVPDFQLADEVGRLVALQDALDRGPVAILWVVSAASPICRRALSHYRQALRPALAEGASLLAISLDPAERAAAAGGGDGSAGMHLLGDPGGRVAALFGVLYQPPPALAEVFSRIAVHAGQAASGRPLLPLAATYVVGGDGIAAFAHVEVDPTCRAEPAAVLTALRRLAAVRE